MEIIFERRFRGPLASANGGYAAGRLAAFLAGDSGAVEVTLRLPPPLERPLAVVHDGDVVRLLDGEALVAEARPAEVDVEPPAPVSLDEAEAARTGHVRGSSPDFVECFVCGLREDGLEVHVGPVAGREPVYAAPVELPESRTELVWAAVDCPGAYAVGAEGRGDIVLGRMTARVLRVPRVGERAIATSWPLGEEGRKLYAGTALFASDGELLALSEQVWIAPRR